MHAVGVIAMILGGIGFALAYAGILNMAPRVVWGVMAIAGMVVTIMTRRPSD